MRRAPLATPGGALACALGFLGFLPYPALPAGGATAVQMGDALSVLMVLPWVALVWKRRPYWVYPALLAPLLLATLKVAAGGEGDLLLSLKATSTWALSCLTLVTVQIYAPTYALELLTGIAAATVLHVCLGMWQLHGFNTGQFPLLWLYVNPSFYSVQGSVETIVKYIRRPFGLFPEASAMSSSLAPWVLFWAAQLCGIVRLRRAPARWQRVLFALATAGGLTLIILSQSGHSVVTLAALAPIGLVWLTRCRATVRSYLAVLATFGVVLPLVVWMIMFSLANRVGGGEMGNSSWAERASSLRAGFALMADAGPGTVLLGMGPGQSSPLLTRYAHLEAVWSVLLTYTYETGLVGALAIGWIGLHLVRTWRASRFDLTFAAIGVVWLVGVTLTTSYSQLLPIWIALGGLTVWPSICERVASAPEAVVVAAKRRSSVSRQAAAKPKRSRPTRWTDAAGAGATNAADAAADLGPAPTTSPLWSSRLNRRFGAGGGPA